MPITSLEIAKKTGKKHGHVVRDIRHLYSQIGEFNAVESVYQDSRKRNQTVLTIPNKDFKTLSEKYKGFHRENRIRETASLDTIEQILNIKLVREHRIGAFKVDGYHIDTNTVYEIDGEYHNNKPQKVRDNAREIEIYKLINCSFVRIKV